MNQMIALKKYDWLFVLVLSIAITCVFYGNVILSPDHVLFNSTTGDGLKNYYTASFFINHNESWTNFEGMNYPYGESITYTDGHPLLSYLLRCICSIIPEIGNHVVGIINLSMLASFSITAITLLAIFKHLKIESLLSVLASVAIAFMAPQVLRLWAGHYALTYGFCIPLTILLVLKLETKKKKFYFLISIQTLVWFLTHAYLGLIASGIVLLYGLLVLLLSFKNAQDKTHSSFTILSGIVPLILFFVFMKTIDIHEDRPIDPVGLFEFKAQFESIFVPHNDFLGSPAVYFGNSDFNWEGHSYIGIVSILCILIFLSKSVIVSIKKKQFILFNDWLNNRTLKLLLLISILFLIHSMLIPFKWNLESWMDFLPFVKQFRAPGRFSWMFFFVITICSVFIINELLKGLQYKYIKVFVSILIPLLFFAESVYNLNLVAKSLVQTDEAFLSRTESPSSNQLSQNIHSEKYQAIINLPYHHVGSDVYVKHVDTQNSLKPSLQLSNQLGLPLLSIHLTRTSLTETKKLLPLFSDEYEQKDISNDFKSQKPFLVFFSGEGLTKKEQAILDRAIIIKKEEDKLLAELRFEELFTP